MNIPDEYEKFRRRTAETHVGDSLEQRIAFSEGCRAGMLAAADIVETCNYGVVAQNKKVAKIIREAAE